MKSFLEEYGFAVLASIVIIMLIVFTTPIGNAIKVSITSTIDQTSSKTDLKMKEINNTNDVESFQKDLTEEYSEFHKTHPDVDYNTYSKNVVEVKFKQIANVNKIGRYVSEISKEDNVIKTKAYYIYGGWNQSGTDYRKAEHIYFMSADVMQENPSGVYMPDFATNDLKFSNDSKMSNQWEHKFKIGVDHFTSYLNDKQIQLCLYDPRTSDWSFVYTKNIILVDLTEAFGEGNEPSAAEFDAMVGDKYYPYGEHTIYVYMPDIKDISK